MAKITENPQVQLVFTLALVGAIVYFIFKFKKNSEKSAVDELGKGGSVLDETKTLKPSEALALKKKYPQGISAGISQNKWTNWSKRIWDAKSPFGDNETAVYSVFREAKSQYDITLFAKLFKLYYYNKNRYDLFQFLESFMNIDELARVQEIIKQKPKI